MGSKSKTDIAYDVISGKKRGVTFQKLWETVVKQTKAKPEGIAQFYSDLTLDSRFVLLKDGKWDLSERRKYEESHVDISSIELGEDEPEESNTSEFDTIKDDNY